MRRAFIKILWKSYQASFNSFINNAACSLVLITWWSDECATTALGSDFLPSCFAFFVSAATLRAIVCFIPKNMWVESNVRLFSIIVYSRLFVSG